MNEANYPSWCEEIDDVVIQCDEALRPAPEDVQIIIRQFCRLLGNAPGTVKDFLEDPGRDIYEPLLSQDACEKVLLLTCERVGIMVSRPGSSGISMATVAIGELDVECSFSSKSSLALALTGALCLSAISILNKRGQL